jgi:hypothetical protein
MATRKKTTARKAKSTRTRKSPARSTKRASKSASRTTKRTAKQVSDAAINAAKAAPQAGYVMAEAMKNTANVIEGTGEVMEDMTRQAERAMKGGRGGRRTSRR